MKILVAGDFCQKYRVDEAIRNRNFPELFDNVKPIVEAADYSIVNFEFPIIRNKSNSIPIVKSGPNFKGSIEAIDAIKYAGFKCCTLANNHILDQGEYCCIDTKNQLEQAGIDTVGVGETLSEASKILYKKIGNKIIAVINCCENEYSVAKETTAGANPLNPINQYYRIQEAKLAADYVIVIVHGGHEHYQLPSPRMQETYRFFIDVGADAVINHHQHCYSGYENYKGKPIFYGIGNFCFDHLKNRHTPWNEGYMVELCIFEGSSATYKIIPYWQGREEMSIKIMNNTSAFNANIEKLNLTISNVKQLQFETNQYYTNNGRWLIQMYQTSFVKKALCRIFPSIHMLGLKKLVMIKNQNSCESHRDRQLYVLDEEIKKYTK